MDEAEWREELLDEVSRIRTHVTVIAFIVFLVFVISVVGGVIAAAELSN